MNNGLIKMYLILLFFAKIGIYFYCISKLISKFYQINTNLKNSKIFK